MELTTKLRRWCILLGGVGALTWSATIGGCGRDKIDCLDLGHACVCAAGDECEFECSAPPCNLTCEGNNPSCTGACGNGSCTCGDGAKCDFTCQSPPCHVTCGEKADCSGTCANGVCTCGKGSTCDFTCETPPCQAVCEGQNPSCTGTCANGSCVCGPGSTCSFTCASGPCHTTCSEGAVCVVHCPNGNAGTKDCDITGCDSGAPTICPDGRATTCGAPCPP